MAEQAAAPMVYDFDDIYTYPSDDQSSTLNEPYVDEVVAVKAKKRKMYKTKFDPKSHKRSQMSPPHLFAVSVILVTFNLF